MIQLYFSENDTESGLVSELEQEIWILQQEHFKSTSEILRLSKHLNEVEVNSSQIESDLRRNISEITARAEQAEKQVNYLKFQNLKFQNLKLIEENLKLSNCQK